MLSDASSGAGASIALQQPDAQALAAVDARLDAKAFVKAAADKQLATHFTAVLSGWCDTVQDLLQAGLGGTKDSDGAGTEAVALRFC